MQPLDTAATRMQTSAFGKSKSLWATLTEGTWQEAYAGFGASLVLVSNPAIQVSEPYYLTIFTFYIFILNYRILFVSGTLGRSSLTIVFEHFGLLCF